MGDGAVQVALERFQDPQQQIKWIFILLKLKGEKTRITKQITRLRELMASITKRPRGLEGDPGPNY